MPRNRDRGTDRANGGCQCGSATVVDFPQASHNHRKTAPGKHFHQLLGTSEFDAPNEQSAAHAADQCLFKDSGESPALAGDPFPALQLLPDSPNLARDTRNGSGNFGPCLERRRNYVLKMRIQKRPLPSNDVMHSPAL